MTLGFLFFIAADDDPRALDGVEAALVDVPGVVAHYREAPGSLVVETGGDDLAMTETTLVSAAVDAGVNLVTYGMSDQLIGELLVDASGDPTSCRMWTSVNRVVLHADRAVVHDLLARSDRTRAPGTVLSLEPVDPEASPVPGILDIRVTCLPQGRWTVEHRCRDRTFILGEALDGSGEVEDIVGAFLDGDADAFFAVPWIRTRSDIPERVTFHFFRAVDFDDAPAEFRTDRDFSVAAPEFLAYASDDHAADPVPDALARFAAWMNRRAVQSADDPEHPPAHQYMDLTPYPVVPLGRMLTVTIPLNTGIHDDTFDDFLLRAASENLCMIESSGRVWVNATGTAGPGEGNGTGLRIELRGGGLVAVATQAALRASLESAVVEGTEGFILTVEASSYGAGTPVPGVREVLVGISDRQWIVHYRTEDSRFLLANPGSTVEDVVGVLDEFMSGEGEEFLGREWRDISEGTVPDESNRWQLSDSAGNVLSVGETEVHVAVPMNYSSELDWFQVADQVVHGDYITADRHLGSQWSVMWGHNFGEVQYYRCIVETRDEAEALIHAYIDEPEKDFLTRKWELVDND